MVRSVPRTLAMLLAVGDLALAARIEPIGFATIATARFPVLLALE